MFSLGSHHSERPQCGKHRSEILPTNVLLHHRGGHLAFSLNIAEVLFN